MIAAIIAWCARNRLATLLLVGLATGWGVLSVRATALDALPDLSDVQVIVFSEWMGRAPDLVEDNITYPVVSSMLGSPRVTAVRGQSMFGMSFVNVIFEDGTDLYWARSRVLEKLSTISGRLPQGVTPILGPDATGVGWVFEYALVDKTGHQTLQQLQSLQDWNVRYALEAVPGVSEVASVGGFVKEYQVDLDPVRLAALGIPLSRVVEAVRMSNADVGGRILEVSGAEHYVRGRGYVKNPQDLEKVVLGSQMGRPVVLRDVGAVRIGPAQRRGLADLDGEGEVVGASGNFVPECAERQSLLAIRRPDSHGGFFRRGKAWHRGDITMDEGAGPSLTYIDNGGGSMDPQRDFLRTPDVTQGRF